MPVSKKKFGYLPLPLELEARTNDWSIRINTLPDLEEKICEVKSDQYGGIYQGQIYSPRAKLYDFGNRKTYLLPYNARVFSLPKTHTIEHDARETDEKQVDFLVWALSFFLGTRLTTTEAGYVDATPVEQGKLVDFSFHTIQPYPAPRKLLIIANEFWLANDRKTTDIFCSAQPC